MDPARLEFVRPWEALSAEHAEMMLREVRRALSPGHPLYSLVLIPIARSQRADDVLLKLEDGRVAVVHLTWRRSHEKPPWPTCQIYMSFDEWAKEVMDPGSRDT